MILEYKQRMRVCLQYARAAHSTLHGRWHHMVEGGERRASGASKHMDGWVGAGQNLVNDDDSKTEPHLGFQSSRRAQAACLRGQKRMAGFHDEEDKELGASPRCVALPKRTGSCRLSESRSPCAESAVRNLWRQMRLLPPSSARHRRWTSLLVLLYFINLMLMPIDVCFYHLHVRDPPGVPFYLISDPIDYAIDGIFMIDLFLTFQMTYRIEETNELVTERRLIGGPPRLSRAH